MEKLYSTADTDCFGTVYGTIPPSNTQISSTVNMIVDELELKEDIINFLLKRIEKLESLKYKSGYLRSIYG